MSVAKSEQALWRWQHAGREAPALAKEAIFFEAIEGWRDDNHCDALACYLRSVQSADRSLPKPHDAAIPSLLADRAQARRFFEKNFVAFRVEADAGLLTSYFEPILPGSRTPSPAFPVPVYRRPPDLKQLPPGHVLAAAGLTAGRETGRHFAPYPARAEIDAGALKERGLEILYLSDAIDAFIMHVQGSGRIELDDGTAVRLAFDGKNGHPYMSVARRLIERGELSAEDADLEGMVAWLRAQPDPAPFLQENESYAFFREAHTSEAGPISSMGVELFAGRSLAADPLYHCLGIPIWVSAPDLVFSGGPFRRLTIAQDTGSAIRGPQRGDIFAGSGAEAGRIAGRVRHKCVFIILEPRC